MDTILVVNAGSSSVKFQVFETNGKSALTRLIKGQMDGIGVRPRLRAAASDGAPLIDAAYAPERVGDAAAALALTGAWLREHQQLEPIAVGHRVVHGGPRYDRPVLVDAAVLADLERAPVCHSGRQQCGAVRLLLCARPARRYQIRQGEPGSN